MADKSKTEVLFEEKNGRTYSRRKEYFEDGTLAREGIYSCGNGWAWDIPAGTITTYFKSGQLMSVEEFDDCGNHDGESVFYNEKGKVTLRIHYVKDKKIREEVVPEEL